MKAKNFLFLFFITAIIPNRPENEITINVIKRLPPKLTCPESFGYPVPHIAFFYYGEMISNSTNNEMIVHENMMNNRRNDSVWECVVTNKHGSDFYQFNVEGKLNKI